MILVENKYKIQNYSENMTDDELFEFCAINETLHIERDKHQNIIIMPPTSGFSGYCESSYTLHVAENYNAKTHEICVRRRGYFFIFASFDGFIGKRLMTEREKNVIFASDSVSGRKKIILAVT